MFIVSAKRTPIGKFKGSLSSLPASDLGALSIKACLEETSLNPEKIDEVIVGQVLGAGTGQAPARQTMLKAGIPSSVPAFSVNKVCGSGMKALLLRF